MKAEHAYHVERDQLVSPRRILNTTTGARIEKQGQAAGQEGDKSKVEKQEGERQEKEGERQENHSAPSIAPLPRAVLAVGGTLGVGKRQGKRGASNNDTLPRAVLSVGESSREMQETGQKDNDEQTSRSTPG